MKTSSVDCPRCHAPQGNQCVTRSGRPRRGPHRERLDEARRAFRRPRRYVLKCDLDGFDLRAGDILVCEPYSLDPGEKGTVRYREPDLLDPGCNVYWHQVTPLDGDDGVVDEMRHAVNLTQVHT